MIMRLNNIVKIAFLAFSLSFVSVLNLVRTLMILISTIRLKHFLQPAYLVTLAFSVKDQRLLLM